MGGGGGGGKLTQSWTSVWGGTVQISGQNKDRVLSPNQGQISRQESRVRDLEGEHYLGSRKSVTFGFLQHSWPSLWKVVSTNAGLKFKFSLV